jgi:hypothetical protein
VYDEKCNKVGDALFTKKNYEKHIEYSDGDDVETRITEALKKCNDVSVLSEELESHIFIWASFTASKPYSNKMG